MANTTNISIRIDTDVKAKADALPNAETVQAMLEAERIAGDPSVKGYNNLDNMFADLEK